ncbi:MAG: hypothetical protein WAU01_08180 [Saprospiraceae bacterium]
MKKKILDIRTYITIILVLSSLIGPKWSMLHRPETDAQNLNFIHPATTQEDISTVEGNISSLGQEYDW